MRDRQAGRQAGIVEPRKRRGRAAVSREGDGNGEEKEGRERG